MKVFAPAAINALIEALTNIYWYKKDLRRFLISTLNDTSILSTIDWDDYKRNITSNLVSHMVLKQELYRDEIIHLMVEVGRMHDFSHLLQLEDGKVKARLAKQSVDALKSYINDHQTIINESDEIKR